MTSKYSLAVMYLIENEPCYGHLIMAMNVTKDDSVKTAGVYITSKVNMVYSPKFLESLTIPHAAAVLKHECEHIFRNHIPRMKEMGLTKKSEMKRSNIAQDACINTGKLETIANEIGGVTLGRINDELKGLVEKFNAKEENKNKQKTFSPIESGRSSEYVYSKLCEAAEEFKEELQADTHDDHDIWEKSEGGEEVLTEVVRQAVNSAVNKTGIGNVPADILAAHAALNAPKVNWRAELRRFEAQAIKANKESTRTKRHRKYGIVYPGKKKEFIAHLAVCVDTSGSMQGERLNLAWNELCGIHARGVKITLIEADAAVQRVSDFDPKKFPDFKGGGGTLYSPPIEKAKELKPDGIVFLGDFDSADTPKDPKIKFLGVGVGDNKTPPAQFGRIIMVTEDKK